MKPAETAVLDQIREALQGTDWRLEPVMTFTHGIAVQVYAKQPNGRYKKVGPFIVPNEGENVSHVLALLGTMTQRD